MSQIGDEMDAGFEAFIRLPMTLDALAKCRRADDSTIIALLYAAYWDAGRVMVKLALSRSRETDQAVSLDAAEPPDVKP